MKVKVGDTVYDGAVEPIMVILSDVDKRNIANMGPDARKYACFPEDTELSVDERTAWMLARTRTG